jgi:phasin family protein
MTTKSKNTNETMANGWTNGWNGKAPFEAMAAEGRETFESFVKASTIATQGYGAIAEAWLSLAKGAMEANAEATKALMGARNWSDLTDAQTDHMKTSFDRTVAESGRIGEMAVKTSNEAIAPIRARFETAVERFTKQAA